MVDTATVPNQPAPAIDPNANPGGDGTNAPTGATGERPEWLPEKFGTAEEMAASYAELEKKLSGEGEVDPLASSKADGTDGTGEGDKKEGTESNQNVSYGEAVDKALETAGLSPDSIFKEYEENDHTLSDATYEALNKAGYPRETVNQFVRGFEAEVGGAEGEADASIEQIMTDIGGREEFGRMSDWAAANLKEEDLSLYNRLVDTGTPDTARMAVLTLRGWYEAATGSEPKLQKGPGGKPSTDVFQSPQEMAAAMTAARNAKDPAAIKAVEQKALRSAVFG